MDTLTQSIARFACGFAATAVPAASLAVARYAFTDLLGVMLAGGTQPVARILTQATAASAHQGRCTVLLDPDVRRSAADAALVNGTAAHALDFDDVQFNAHPSTVLVPAILAEAERGGKSGLDMEMAYVLGYEVWGELHSRESHPYHDKGWHPTAMLGPLAATAAVAFLRGLDVEQTRAALSLSASFVGGVVGNFGSMAKPMHAGRAAACAITAVDWAQVGLTAGADAIGARDGLLAALSPQGKARLDGATRLGERWFSLTTPLMVKKYPVCFSTHRPLDGILEIARAHGLKADDVADMHISVRGTQARVLRFDRPRNALEGKFSMQFAAACAMLRGGVGLMDLDDGFVASEPVQSFFDKVRFTHLPLLGDGTPPLADRVVITTTDGRVLDSGDLMIATPHTRLKEKFIDCCAAGGYPHGQALFARLASLEQLGDARELAMAGRTPAAAPALALAA